MKLKEGLLLCKVGDSSVVMATGSAMHLRGLTTVNETGEFIWSLLQSETDEDTIVRAMCETFEVDEQTAREDAHAFIHMLQEAGFLC